MKGIIAIIILVLLGVGFFAFQGGNVSDVDELLDTDSGTLEDGDAMEKDDAMKEDGDAMEHDDSDASGDAMEEGSTNEPTTDAGSETEAPAETSTEGGAKTFNLTGVNFAFSETEMRVKKGDTVTVNFESTSGFHDWVVDEFDAATQQVQPGTPTSVTFVADKTGEFEYYCSVGNHRAQGMVGTLIVEE